MTENLLAASKIAEIPDDAIPISGVLVLSYMLPDTEGAFATVTLGDDQVSQMIGLMQMAIHSLMHEANPTPCEDFDDA